MPEHLFERSPNRDNDGQAELQGVPDKRGLLELEREAVEGSAQIQHRRRRRDGFLVSAREAADHLPGPAGQELHRLLERLVLCVLCVLLFFFPFPRRGTR